MPIIAVLPIVIFFFGLYFTWHTKKIKWCKKLLLSLGVVIVSFVGLGVILVNSPSASTPPIETDKQTMSTHIPSPTTDMVSINPSPIVSTAPTSQTGAYHYDPATGKWISSDEKTVTGEAVLHPNHPDFIRATGFIDKGVSLYSEEDGEMVLLFEVKDVAYHSIIDGCAFTYGLELYDVIDKFTEWRDGLYWSQLDWLYIKADDPNRKTSYQDVNEIASGFSWSSLRAGLAPDIVVFQGTEDFKCAVFTVVEYRVNDYIRLQYPNGSIEDKDYNAIIFDSSLSILQRCGSSAEQCSWSLSAGKLYDGVMLYRYTMTNGFIKYGTITGITTGKVIMNTINGKRVTLSRDYVTRTLYVKEDLSQ